jgi:hypothetical protein
MCIVFSASEDRKSSVDANVPISSSVKMIPTIFAFFNRGPPFALKTIILFVPIKFLEGIFYST